MEVFTNSKIDFIGRRTLFAGVSAVVVILALTAIATKGFKFGVEFEGGTQITAVVKGDIPIEEVRQVLADEGLDAKPTTLGGAGEGESMFLIRVGKYYRGDADLGAEMRAALVAKFGEDAVTYWNYDPGAGDRAKARVDLGDGKPPTESQITNALADYPGLSGVKFEHVEIDRAGEINISLQSLARDVVNTLKEKFHTSNDSFSIEAIGPGVAADLQVKGFLSLIVACLLILGYIWFRFDLDFAPGAVLALIHDALITAGIFAFFELEFNVPIVAALLAIIGYSVNDTVVVYDRIRENIELSGDSQIRQLVNKSINETLSRTILTSVTTLIATLSITFLGGPILQPFGIALTIGVVVGTYSSIFVAASLMLALHGFFRRRRTGGAAATA